MNKINKFLYVLVIIFPLKNFAQIPVTIADGYPVCGETSPLYYKNFGEFIRCNIKTFDKSSALRNEDMKTECRATFYRKYQSSISTCIPKVYKRYLASNLVLEDDKLTHTLAENLETILTANNKNKINCINTFAHYNKIPLNQLNKSEVLNQCDLESQFFSLGAKLLKLDSCKDTYDIYLPQFVGGYTKKFVDSFIELCTQKKRDSGGA